MVVSEVLLSHRFTQPLAVRLSLRFGGRVIGGAQILRVFGGASICMAGSSAHEYGWWINARARSRQADVQSLYGGSQRCNLI